MAKYWVEQWNQDNPERKVARLRLIYYKQYTSKQAAETKEIESSIWATVEDEKNAGSLFDQLKENDSPLDFGSELILLNEER